MPFNEFKTDVFKLIILKLNILIGSPNPQNRSRKRGQKDPIEKIDWREDIRMAAKAFKDSEENGFGSSKMDSQQHFGNWVAQSLREMSTPAQKKWMQQINQSFYAIDASPEIG